MINKIAFEKIIYDTCREVMNVEDKLKIATVFLFCNKLGNETLSELLYTESHELFINNLNQMYNNYEIDLLINFSNPNVKNAFYKTLEKYKEKYDSKGFLKALYLKDEFAIAINNIIQTPIV